MARISMPSIRTTDQLAATLELHLQDNRQRTQVCKGSKQHTACSNEARLKGGVADSRPRDGLNLPLLKGLFTCLYVLHVCISSINLVEIAWAGQSFAPNFVCASSEVSKSSCKASPCCGRLAVSSSVTSEFSLSYGFALSQVFGGNCHLQVC